jgi:hypothetical protein
MAFPLLHQILADTSRNDLQCALLMVDTRTGRSSMCKSGLIAAIELHAERADASHAALCRYLLSPKTKVMVNALIRTTEVVTTTTKKKHGSIEALIQLDADARRARVESQLQLVHCPPPDHQELVPLVPQRVGLAKLWRKAAARNRKRLIKSEARAILSRKITRCIEEVLHESAPARRIDNVVKEVQRKVGSPLSHGAARVFLFKKLRSSLIKRKQKAKQPKR